MNWKDDRKLSVVWKFLTKLFVVAFEVSLMWGKWTSCNVYELLKSKNCFRVELLCCAVFCVGLKLKSNRVVLCWKRKLAENVLRERVTRLNLRFFSCPTVVKFRLLVQGQSAECETETEESIETGSTGSVKKINSKTIDDHSSVIPRKQLLHSFTVFALHSKSFRELSISPRSVKLSLNSQRFICQQLEWLVSCLKHCAKNFMKKTSSTMKKLVFIIADHCGAEWEEEKKHRALERLRRFFATTSRQGLTKLNRSFHSTTKWRRNEKENTKQLAKILTSHHNAWIVKVKLNSFSFFAK